MSNRPWPGRRVRAADFHRVKRWWGHGAAQWSSPAGRGQRRMPPTACRVPGLLVGRVVKLLWNDWHILVAFSFARSTMVLRFAVLGPSCLVLTRYPVT